MNIFTLFGQIAIDNGQANEAIDQTTGKAKNSQSKMTEAFKKIGKAAAKYFTVLKIIDFGKELVNLAASAESAAAKVNTLLSPGTDTTKYFEDMLAASSATGVAMTDFAEAVYSSISASVDQADAVAFTTDAIKLAKAGFTSASTAVDVLTTAINAYGMSADDATHISDVLITTQNLGKTTVDELASSMGKVIPIASAYGVNLENLSASYAVLTKGGIGTAEATTYTKSMLTELSNTGSKVAKVLKKQTGKSFSELMASGSSLGDVLAVLYTAAGENSTAFANLWSSTEAGTGALALANAGVEEFNNTLDAMGNSANATEAAYQQVTGTFNEQANRLKTNLENVGIQIANKFLPALTDIVSALADNVGPAFDWICGVFDNFGAMFEGVVDNGVVNFSLLGERISGMFTDLGNKIPDLLNSVGEAISNAWTNVVWPNIQNLFKAVFGIDLPDWETTKQLISDGWTNTVWPAVQDYFKTTFGIDLPDWETTKEAISGWWDNVWGGIKTLFNAVFSIFTEDDDGTTVIERIKTWWDKVITAIVDLFCAVFGVNPEDGENLVTKISNWWSGVKESIKDYFFSMFSILTDDSTTVSEKIQKWWEAVVELVGNIFGAVFSLLFPLIKTVVESIKNWWNGVVSNVVLKIPIVGEIVSGLNSMKKTAQQIKEDPVGTFDKLNKPLSVLFRAQGAVFSEPTLFDTRMGYQVVGEAGPEAVAPIDVLQGYVRSAVADANGSSAQSAEIAELKELVRDLIDELPDMMVSAFSAMRFDVNNREFARMVRQVT